MFNKDARNVSEWATQILVRKAGLDRPAEGKDPLQELSLCSRKSKDASCVEWTDGGKMVGKQKTLS